MVITVTCPSCSSSFPVDPDKTATSWTAHQHPKSMTTGSDGKAELDTPWGMGIRCQVDSRPSAIIYLLSVKGGASDVATEITTSIWEHTRAGCNYCNKAGVNGFGTWSHTVVFKKDPNASQVCDVPSDHAGQKACPFDHLFHDPQHASCVPVAN